jgi:LacI family transcriptional regulator
MANRATIIDIARAAGVSKSTVSLILTGSGKVKPETEQAVRAAMRELGYVYNRGAASLRHPQSRIVGMVINDLSNPFFAELAIGIERVLRTSGYVPFMANTSESLVRQAEVIRSMYEHGASGIILCPAIDTDAKEVATLSGIGVPIVLAIRRVVGAKVPLVAPDNRAGAEQAVERLTSLGHTRIAFLGGFGPMGVREDRLEGFASALRTAGLTVDPSLIIEAPPTKDGGFAAMSSLLDRPGRPTAALCFNDVVAIGAMYALTRHGLVPGRDMAVIGFDDTAEARHASPALTTVSVGVDDLGQRAAQLLLRRIEGTASVAESYIGETLLVIRESCGAHAVKEVA